MTDDLTQFKKDFEFLCAQHQIPTAIFVGELQDKIIVASEHKDDPEGTESKAINEQLANIFSHLDIKADNLLVLHKILLEKLAQFTKDAEYYKLSETDQLRIDEIRYLKNKYVKEGKYEEASILRNEERKILGLPDLLQGGSNNEDDYIIEIHSLLAKSNKLMEAVAKSQTKAKKKIFLGGTCNNSQWREQLIPLLNDSNDPFNPVVENWTPECQANEIKEREAADYVLYVITPKMTGVFAIAEVIEDANKRPEKTIFCVLEKDGDLEFTPHQLKSLNATKDLVRKNDALVFDTLEQIAEHLNNSGWYLSA